MHLHLSSPLYSSFWSFPVFQPCPRPQIVHPDRMAAAWGDWLGASVRLPPLEGLINHSCVCRAWGTVAEELPGSCELTVLYLQSANKQCSDINILLQQRLTHPCVPGYIDILWIREDMQSIFFHHGVCSHVQHPWSCSSHSDTCMKWDFWRKKRGCASVPQLKQACVFFGGVFCTEIGVHVRTEGEIKETRVDGAAVQYSKACFSLKIRLQELTDIIIHVTWSWMWLFLDIYFFCFFTFFFFPILWALLICCLACEFGALISEGWHFVSNNEISVLLLCTVPRGLHVDECIMLLSAHSALFLCFLCHSEA